MGVPHILPCATTKLSHFAIRHGVMVKRIVSLDHLLLNSEIDTHWMLHNCTMAKLRLESPHPFF